MDVDGILLVDKSEGVTSFDVVKKVRKILGVKKVGHTGTLDKFASGLLIVCIGRATVVQQIFMKLEKTYLGTLRLGIETDTLDPYGKVIQRCKVEKYTNNKIMDVLMECKGTILQIPPFFSAIHHEGERMYKLARRGEKFTPKPRKVEVKDIKLIENKTLWGIPEIIFETTVSSGTYIRALGRDISKKLGTCGHLVALRRLRIGRFSVENAVSFGTTGTLDLDKLILPLNEALSDLPEIKITPENILKVKNGVQLDKIIEGKLLRSLSDGFFRITSCNNLIAIGQKERNKYSFFRVIITDTSKIEKMK